MNPEPNHTNRLIHSNSPYLKQHAHNPVDWFPWGNEALDLSFKTDKPILVSIGYSACHWCHVMERESFEDAAVADMMNANFICIKVDREEHPDVDQVYMDAVHALGMQGGWPLNVFLTPNQKPFYGVTYLPSDRWTQLLRSINETFRTNRQKLEASAEEITSSISTSDVEKYNLIISDDHFNIEVLRKGIEKIAGNFDAEYGGMQRAPKFPMPSVWSFLLKYSHVTGASNILSHVLFTLKQIARGGIFDHLGGGFARYSTDKQWFAPHFEKMLYDNGQLLSLYANAFLVSRDKEFLQVIDKTAGWLEREMLSPEGGVYSALDADSEGVEGKYYVWKEKELDQLLDKHAKVIKAYYNTTTAGNWENHTNILFKTNSDANIAEKLGLTTNELEAIVQEGNTVLSKHREARTKPGLDNKILAGWNGMAVSGLVDAFLATGKNHYLVLAEKIGAFIINNLIQKNAIIRVHKSKISGVLEDYSFVISGFLDLYQATFNFQYLQQAIDLTNYTLEYFFDRNEGLFYYTDTNSHNLVSRKKEIFDNVIPSSNSQMADNLRILGILTDQQEWTKIASEMTGRMERVIETDTEFVANWASNYLAFLNPNVEVIIMGKELRNMNLELAQKYYPFKVVAGSESATSQIPLLENREPINGKTTIYVCFNKACKLPVHSVDEALKQLPAFEST